VSATDAVELFNEQLCTLPVIDSVTAPAGLVGWWRAEGDARDAAGMNHGSLCNGAGFAAGKVRQAFSLDGTDDCVEIPDAPALRLASLTLEAWVALDAQPGLRVIFAKPLGVGNKDSYAVWVDAGTLKGVVADAAGLEGPVLITSFSPVPGRWYHVAYTFDDVANQQALYIDGIQVAIGDVTKSIGYDAQPLLLGRDTENGIPKFFLKGRIDEAAIYNRALSGTEIASIYNAGPAGKRLLVI
jgi:Concanavalin A-like lectin/glucanases superfamily